MTAEKRFFVPNTVGARAFHFYEEDGRVVVVENVLIGWHVEEFALANDNWSVFCDPAVFGFNALDKDDLFIQFGSCFFDADGDTYFDSLEETKLYWRQEKKRVEQRGLTKREAQA
jgi:hypothetical protein